MRRRLITIVSLIIIALVAVFSFGAWQRTQAARKYVQSTTPTIFVHGWGSSANAETKMTHAAKLAGVTRVIVRANVDRHGKVSFSHAIPKNAVNPIVEVNLADNKLSSYRDNYVQGYHHGAGYIKNVVLALERQHHYSAVNFVGHSMGNLEIINYINDNRGDKRLPKVNHLVAIAGHYNGLFGDKGATGPVAKSGKPARMTPTYRPLVSLHKTFPKNTRVLNIYGNKEDGSHSDGAVPINSAKTLKYLVTRAKSYRQVEVKGPKAQHSQLHNNNKQVNRLLINFLWQK